MTAHNVAARRGLRHYAANNAGFEELAKTEWSAISAGAPFPDYFYTCGADPGAGEEAHWPLFQSAAAEYIRANWTTEQILLDERPRKLTAFLMGLVSHYIADLNWHGLDVVPSAHGFIEQVGILNFNCSGDLDCRDRTAHKTCDIGGEFVSAWELDLGFYEPKEWFIPVEDLVKIFEFANATLSSSDACYQGDVCFPLIEPKWITDCAFLFGVGSWAIKEFGGIIWPFWEQTALNGAGAPHLTEAYLTWPVGGIDDDAMWTAAMWNRWEEWLVDGPPSVLPHSSDPSDNEPGRGRRLQRRRTAGGHSARDLYRGMKSTVQDLREGGGVPFEIVASGPANHSHGVSIRMSAGASAAQIAIWRNGALQLAEALALAAGIGPSGGSPETLPAGLRAALKARSAELFPDQGANAELAQPTVSADAPLQILSGAVATEYLGSALALGDLLPAGGGDGCVDAVIGAPGFSEHGVAQRGRVRVFAGVCGETEGNVSFADEPGLEMKGVAADHGRFGEALAVGDLDADGLPDIVIGAPSTGSLNLNASVGNYTGKVFVRLSSSSGTTSVRSPDGGGGGEGDGSGMVVIECDVPWASFGASLAVGDLNADGIDDLVAGAPYAGESDPGSEGGAVDVLSAGRVYVFFGPFAPGAHLTSPAADVVLTGGKNFSWFGSKVAVVSEESQLLVSAPAHRLENTTGSVGRIDCFDFSSMKAGLVGAGGAVLAWRLEGDTWMAKTGFSFAVQDSGGDGVEPLIAVSSPTMDGTLQHPFGGAQLTSTPSLRERRVKHAGQVLLLKMKDLANLDGSVISWSSAASLPSATLIHGTEAYGRLGWSLTFARSEGLRGSSAPDLLLMAAPLSERERGRVYVKKLDALPHSRPVETETGVLSMRSISPAPRSSRFGEGGLIAAGRGRVLVGAPRLSNSSDGEAGEMLGAAFLMGL